MPNIKGGEIQQLLSLNGHTDGYIYDSAGNRIGIRYPDESVVKCIYDKRRIWFSNGMLQWHAVGGMEMLSRKEMLQLRASYIEIGKLVQKYGGYKYYSVLLKALMRQVECIDSDEDDNDKLQYLVGSYDGLFVYKGGLSDFVIEDENGKMCKQLNERLRKESKKIWEILKDYYYHNK